MVGHRQPVKSELRGDSLPGNGSAEYMADVARVDLGEIGAGVEECRTGGADRHPFERDVGRVLAEADHPGAGHVSRSECHAVTSLAARNR